MKLITISLTDAEAEALNQLALYRQATPEACIRDMIRRAMPGGSTPKNYNAQAESRHLVPAAALWNFVRALKTQVAQGEASELRQVSPFRYEVLKRKGVVVGYINIERTEKGYVVWSDMK